MIVCMSRTQVYDNSFDNTLNILDEFDNCKGNPFKMPPDNDIFLLRDKERQRKKQVLITHTIL